MDGLYLMLVISLLLLHDVASFQYDTVGPFCRHRHRQFLSPSCKSVSRSSPTPSIVFQSSLFSSASGNNLDLLPPPPRKEGLFRRFRDTFSYLKNPDQFIAERSAELGPVFTMYQFFKPVVVVGGQEAVKEFTSKRESEAQVIFPSLPETFLDLHTKWGALNLDSNDILFKQARGLFKDVLQTQEALEYHTTSIEPFIDEYVDELVQRVKKNPNEPLYLVPELKNLCLQVFSKIFSGQGLTEKQVQQFIDYNAGLLSLGKSTKSYTTAMESLQDLKGEMLRRFRLLDDVTDIDVPGKFYHTKVYGREGFEDEDRIGTGIVLFVWGAYVECASLMIDALALMRKYHDSTEARDQVLKEYKKQKQTSGYKENEYKFWSGMPYTVGVLRETLRLEPPGAGVPRFGTNDFELAGYRIPSNMPVMMDPRIGNNDPNLYQEPQSFEPLRWTPVASDSNESSSKCPFAGTAAKLGPGSWFPGGNGAHRCPGVPLAELVSSMFVAKMSDRFASWEFSGSGLDSNGDIKYVNIPVKIPPDDFGIRFQVRQ